MKPSPVSLRRRQRMPAAWIGFLWLLATTVRVDAAPATPALQKQVRAATFEVVMPKPQKDGLVYEQPLPLELLPFTERNDKYWSVGTAFAIGPDTYVSAGHVMLSGVGSQFGIPSLRDSQGNVYAVDRVLKFSLDEDFMVFTISGAVPVKFLDTSGAPAVDDPVFAVGNALGEGVVIRDGLLTSMTPEDQDGRWKWLRFSAAASPGNSGGPLLDASGRVIGIVIARSPGENLNYALPIGRVSADIGKAARFDVRQSFGLPLLKQTQVAYYKDSFALPLPYPEFARRVLASRLKYYTRERDRLLAEQAAQLFPQGDSARVLAVEERPTTPALIAQRDDRSWHADTGTASDSQDLPGDGYVRTHFLGSTGLFQLRRPNAASDEEFYRDSRAFMDLMLKGMKILRPVGQQSIRVTSAGPADRDTPHVDRFGRKWQLRTWPLGFVEVRMFTLALPVPDGYVGLLRFAPSSDADSVTEELLLLANYFQSPYRGTLQQWRAFMARPALRPAVFDRVKMTYDLKKSFEYDSPRLRVSVPADMMQLTDSSAVTLDMLYGVDGGKLAWDVGALRLHKDDSGATYVAAFRQPRPAKDAGKELLQRWDQMSRGEGEFDGTLGHDSEFSVFWVRSSASRPLAGIVGIDPAASVLYELTYRTNEKLLPRDLEYRRAKLRDNFQVLEH